MPNSPIIPWKTRADLSVFELDGEREQTYAVKDVISNEFFRFGEIEFHILELLRKSVTLDGLKQGLQERFGFSLGTDEVTSYLNHLVADNLLVATRYGDGGRLFRQHKRQSSGNRLQQIMGLLSIKLPGFYPGPLLSALEPFGRLLFNPVSIAVATLMFISTLLFAVLSWQGLLARAPAVSELLSIQHLFLITIGFVVAKVLHEIGHGLACRQMGHECSEMGVLLLVMIPCLYCDVSDLWTAKSRYKRMLVSLAGVFIELLLATICFWGWYFSLDGALSRFLFSMMLVTSLNTIFVNGNPLMKYDGYYAMSDFFRVPNLSTLSQQSLNRTVEGFFFQQQPSVILHEKTRWLKLYAVGSFFYRWLILGAIGWMAWTFFENQQLLAFGRLVVGALVVLALLPIVFTFRRYWKNAWDHGIRWGNTIVFLLIVGSASWLVSAVEFEHRVSGTATIELANARQIFAPTSGKVLRNVADGDLITAGAVIAEVIDDDLLLEKMIAAEQVADVTARLDSMELSDETGLSAAEIEFWKKRQSSWQRKLGDVQNRISQLSIIAPREGRFVVQMYPKIDLQQAEEQLRTRGGHWADKQHHDSFVERGENLGYVADAELMEGTLQVAEKDIELIENEQQVRIFLPFEGAFVVGKVSNISVENHLDDEANAASGPTDAKQSAATYNVQFLFPFDERVRIKTSRKAVILCRKTNVFQWTTRWIYNAFWL